MGRPTEPVGEFREEAAMLDSGNKSCARAAQALAKANPGIIVRGGGRKYITLDPPVDGVQHVAYLKATSVSSDGMIRTKRYGIELHRSDVAPEREEFGKYERRDAEARFEELVPDHDNRETVGLGIPSYEAPSFEAQAERFGLEVPDAVREM